jgi:murein DD-endopeptidase MepM/ murein hydrolase activator NlpD
VSDRENGQTAAKPKGATTTGAVYTVVAGDTLSGIAQKTGSSTNAIKQANSLDTGLIRIGQQLVIPGATVHANAASKTPQGVDPIVTGGVTRPAGASVAPKAENAEIEKMVQQAAAAPDATGVGRLRWPAHGRIVSDFGSQSGGKRNDGVDIALPEGTPVKAAENGVVIYAGDGLKDFGNTVLVRHENGLVTVYGHNSEITVSRGTTVRRGQEIARSGVSGNAGTPKLHFEVRKDSAPVDPAKYLE